MRDWAFPSECLVLLSLLASLVGLGCGPSAFRFGFLLRGLALRVGLILLGLAFALNVVATRDRAHNFFGLTLSALDDALDGFFRSAVVLPHVPTPYGWSVGRSRSARSKSGFPRICFHQTPGDRNRPRKSRYSQLSVHIDVIYRLRHTRLRADDGIDAGGAGGFGNGNGGAGGTGGGAGALMGNGGAGGEGGQGNVTGGNGGNGGDASTAGTGGSPGTGGLLLGANGMNGLTE
jgi:hypothetical protein